MTMTREGYHSPARGVTMRQVEPPTRTALLAALAAGELEAVPYDGTSICRLGDLESHRSPAGPTYLERLLEIYETQFDELVSAHPGCQAQTREQLLEMFADEATAIVVYTIDGDPAAATIFVERIAACMWLRESFYEATFPGEQVVYFPGIVTDSARKGRVFSAPMTRFLVEIGRRAQARYRIVFQCTNVSEGYVPLLVGRFASGASGRQVEVQQFWRFAYRALLL